MLPNFLFPEQIVKANGEGLSLPIGDAAAQIVQITLGITEAKEQQSLDLYIFASEDGEAWGAKPVLSFPQKFYKGVWSILLDLAAVPDARFVKVKYKMNRWGHWKDGPEFRFYVFAERLHIS